MTRLFAAFDGSGLGVPRAASRVPTLILVLSLILIVGAAIGFVGPSGAANSPTKVTGDCSNARVADARYLFFVSAPDGLPLSNVTITANGIRGVTNSSGVTVFPSDSIVTFEARVAGTSLPVSLGTYSSPALCLGDSYYRLVSFSVNATA